MKELARETVSCDYCEAEPGKPCTTNTGRRARYMHWARLWVIQKAWTHGYTEATADLTRSFVNEPEWFGNYARREVERGVR